ncbi:MAG: DNA-protecting protein DprA [Candidatus Omnitrophica bacterium]|nr:DNA-protecting protein DprA [Candidatus Omnitrophota bacterium]
MVSDSQKFLLQLMGAGVTPGRIRELLDECATAQAAWEAGPDRWWVGRWLQYKPERSPVFPWQEEVELAARRGAKILTLCDPEYPASLKAIHTPPPLLYLWGDLLPEDSAAVAVVGSRAASVHGLHVAQKLGFDLAAHGVTVVSGLAQGIDSAAHRGALKAGGRTLAVLGSGLDYIFPQDHRGLAEQVSKQGAVISEFPMRSSPLRENFPRRNRIISGLSLGVVVVEAAQRSGALITANFALEQGKEVFAVPGLAGTPAARGTNRLLKDGARLVETAQDIFEELHESLKGCLPHREESGAGSLPRLTSEEAAVYARLTDVPVTMDWVAAQTNQPAAVLLGLLLGMELKGWVRQLSGQRFVRATP